MTDLGLLDCIGRVKLIIHWADLVICNHSSEGKIPSYSQINMVGSYESCFLLKNDRKI